MSQPCSTGSNEIGNIEDGLRDAVSDGGHCERDGEPAWIGRMTNSMASAFYSMLDDGCGPIAKLLAEAICAAVDEEIHSVYNE